MLGGWHGRIGHCLRLGVAAVASRGGRSASQGLTILARLIAEAGVRVISKTRLGLPKR